MLKQVLLPILAVSSLLLSFGVSANSDSEQSAIGSTLTAFTDAWNKHDAKAFSLLFSEDAEFTNVAGESATGRKAVEEFHAPRFASHFKDSRQTIQRFRIKLVKPDVAAVDAWWEMTGARTAANEDAGMRQGLLHLLMVKVEARWQIAVMHNTNLPASRQSMTQ